MPALPVYPVRDWIPAEQETVIFQIKGNPVPVVVWSEDGRTLYDLMCEFVAEHGLKPAEIQFLQYEDKSEVYRQFAELYARKHPIGQRRHG